jgi:hypothetical protein
MISRFSSRRINDLPRAHPFDLRYANVENVDWESCTRVLDAGEKQRALRQSW